MNNIIDNSEKHITACFIDGKWIIYHFCAARKSAYADIPKKKYLGESTMYKVDGKECNTKPYHFWRRS